MAAILLCVVAVALAGPIAEMNLAAHRTATASSMENEEHDASHAIDGSADTCWRADDEPEGVPDWWQVDLGEASNLTAIEITWPYAAINYRYKIEGAALPGQWRTLSDQSKTTSRQQVQRVTIADARAIRFVRITILGFDPGCSASISEVKIFGSTEPHP